MGFFGGVTRFDSLIFLSGVARFEFLGFYRLLTRFSALDFYVTVARLPSMGFFRVLAHSSSLCPRPVVVPKLPLGIGNARRKAFQLPPFPMQIDKELFDHVADGTVVDM